VKILKGEGQQATDQTETNLSISQSIQEKEKEGNEWIYGSE